MLYVNKEFRIVTQVVGGVQEEIDEAIQEFNRIIDELNKAPMLGICILVEQPTIEEKIPEWTDSYTYTEICWKCSCAEDRLVFVKYFWPQFDGTDECSSIKGLDLPWSLYV